MDQPVEKKPDQTGASFDFDAFPADTLFHERRTGRERRADGPAEAPPRPAVPPGSSERREKKERRRRIDPTTFEKQYTDDELEFMNAMQRFKVQSGKAFPSFGDVLRVAFTLGYRKWVDDEGETDMDGLDDSDQPSDDLAITLTSSP